MVSKTDAFVVPASGFAKAWHKSIAQYEGMDAPSIEEEMLQRMLDDIEVSDEPEHDTLVMAEDNHKWRTISALQKAIRRGYTKEAMMYAASMEAFDAKYLWRRLCIIGMEDISFGNPELSLLVMLVHGKVKWRENNGGPAITRYIVEAMAKSVKSRIACEMNVSVLNDPNLLARRAQVVSADPEVNAQYYMNTAHDRRIECLHGLALTGNLSDDYRKTRKTAIMSNGDRGLFVQRMLSEAVPSLIDFWFRKSSATSVEDMQVTLPLIWRDLQAEVSTMKVRLTPLKRYDLIDGYMPSAFDVHNYEGKRALGYFGKACKPIQEAMNAMPEGVNTQKLLGSAVFNADSARLVKELEIDLFRDIFKKSLLAEARKYGLEFPQMMDFYLLVRANIDSLTAARVRVLQDD